MGVVVVSLVLVKVFQDFLVFVIGKVAKIGRLCRHAQLEWIRLAGRISCNFSCEYIRSCRSWD